MKQKAVLIELVDGQIVSRDAEEWMAEQAREVERANNQVKNRVLNEAVDVTCNGGTFHSHQPQRRSP